MKGEPYPDVIEQYIRREMWRRALLTELVLLPVVARSPWAMAYVLRMGYRGPWQMVEHIYRSER